MLLSQQQLAVALDAVADHIGKADIAFDRSLVGDLYGEGNVKWHLELAYTQLLTLAEAQGLPLLRADILRDLKAARKDGIGKGTTDPDGEPYLRWSTPARRYRAALRATFGQDASRTVTKDLESILRATIYPICDRNLFAALPRDERDVHLRIEGILRCVFADVRHKPRLTKAIKHFEPDTGIPSIQTLIEYKYLSSDAHAGTIADELLADTRGYASKDWSSFVYVIYESSRIRPESEWRQLLRECDIDARTTVVVLSGERAPLARRPGRRERGTRSGGNRAGVRANAGSKDRS